MRDTHNYMTPETFEYVLQTIPELKIRKWSVDDIQMLFKILYWLALRPTEGINMKKEDVFLDEREVELGRTKTQKKDIVPIPKLFLDEFRSYVVNKPEGRFFPDLTYNTFIRWIYKLGKMLNIPAWTERQQDTGEKTKGHIFRKANLKDMAYGTYGHKFDPAIIAGQSRHSNPAVLMKHYLKLSKETVKDNW